MENKKKLTIGLIIGLIALFSGVTYAYFTATLQNLGERETSISTETLGNLKLTGETVFTSENLYPGEMGVQEFSIEPVSQGKGIYELDLNAVVPSEFGGDIFITLYRATSNDASVEVTKGELTQEGDNYYKQDTLSTSNVEIIYPASSLTNNSQIVLFQTEFDETLTNTKYYLVYDYRNRGNQNNQMGKSFSATISGRLVKELNGAGVIAKLAGNAPRNSTALIDNGEVKDGEEVVCTNTLAYDDFGNLRYVGDNPCNYVTFNDETPGMYDEYQYYIDRKSIEGYNTLEDCENINENMSRYFVKGQCELNEETNKYDLYIEGFVPALGSYKSEEECANSQKVSNMSERYTGRCAATGKKILAGGWRIVGIVDGTLKIARNESIGNFSWDTSATNVNKGKGINQWGESGDYKGADLMKLLNPGYEENLAEDASGNTISGTYVNNSLYWNKASGNCYNNKENAYTPCDFSTTGLTENAKTMIDNHIWYLGNINNDDENTKISSIYEKERNYNLGKTCTYADDCNDIIERTATWQGKVGLLNASDFYYSSGGTNRENCLNGTELSEEEKANCFNVTWIKGFQKESENVELLLGMGEKASNVSMLIKMSTTINMAGPLLDAYFSTPVRPVVYLKPNVSITGGEGTPTSPYTLSLE